MSKSRKNGEKSEVQDQDNDSEDTGQVNFRVNSQKKDRWKDFADESDYGNLSTFLRRAAEKEIARQEASEGRHQPAHTKTDDSEEILEKLGEVVTKLQSMDRRLSAIEADSYGDEDLKELATRVYKILPTSVEQIQQEQAKKLDGHQANTGTIEDLAEQLEADQASVEMAVQRLRNTTHSVYKTERGDGIEHYYKEV